MRQRTLPMVKLQDIDVQQNSPWENCASPWGFIISFINVFLSIISACERLNSGQKFKYFNHNCDTHNNKLRPLVLNPAGAEIVIFQSSHKSMPWTHCWSADSMIHQATNNYGIECSIKGVLSPKNYNSFALILLFFKKKNKYVFMFHYI